LLKNDVNLTVVSERLGHSKIQITLDLYSHILPTMQQQVVEKLDGLFKQLGTQSNPRGKKASG
jgi:hypothetical protein